MKVELKKVQHVARMSQETECFVAELWLDGRNRGAVSNDGHGGPHSFSDWEAQKELDAYGKTLPPLKSDLFPDGLEMDAELIVSEALSQHLEEKQFRRWCKTKTVFRLPGDKEGEWRTIQGANPATLLHVQSKYPTAEILNLRFQHQ